MKLNLAGLEKTFLHKVNDQRSFQLDFSQYDTKSKNINRSKNP